MITVLRRTSRYVVSISVITPSCLEDNIHKIIEQLSCHAYQSYKKNSAFVFPNCLCYDTYGIRMSYETQKWKNNIYFVLIEPGEPGNIGAAARAIKNMGFSNLCLVNPPPMPSDEARWFACHATDVLDSAVVCSSINDAIKDKAIIIGTSRRSGKKRGIFIPAEKSAGQLCDLAQTNSVAIVFGREDRGLLNKEVEKCGFMISIPSNRSQPSLNLAQAVLIVAYELFKSEFRSIRNTTSWPASTSQFSPSKLVSHEKLSAFYKTASETLELLGYQTQGNRNLGTKILQNMKHLIGRSGLTDWELKMLYGICSRIKKKTTDRL